MTIVTKRSKSYSQLMENDVNSFIGRTKRKKEISLEFREISDCLFDKNSNRIRFRFSRNRLTNQKRKLFDSYLEDDESISINLNAKSLHPDLLQVNLKLDFNSTIYLKVKRVRCNEDNTTYELVIECRSLDEKNRINTLFKQELRVRKTKLS